jgi:hypothetical protein
MGLTKIVNAFQNVSVIGLAKECLLDLLRALGGLHAECTYEAENPALKCERQDWVWLCVASSVDPTLTCGGASPQKRRPLRL